MGLFSPGWMSKHEDKALAALEKLTDEAQLLNAVFKARLPKVQQAALDKINDEKRIVEVVCKFGLPDEIRREASLRVRSDEALEQIALRGITLNGQGYSYALSRDAAGRMNNIAGLTRVIQHAPNDDVRLMATKRKLYVNSFESSALFALLLATQDSSMITWGIPRIHTQDELYRLAKSAAAEQTRTLATEKLCYACLVRLVVENGSRAAMVRLYSAAPELWQEYTDKAFVDRVLVSVKTRGAGVTPDALEFQLLRRLFTVESKAYMVLEQVRKAKLYNAFATVEKAELR